MSSRSGCHVTLVTLAVILLSLRTTCQPFMDETASDKPSPDVRPANVTCPSRCACALRNSGHVNADGALLVVDCSSVKLQAIPGDIPRTAQAVLLKGNAVSSLSGLSGQMTGLMELDLSYNSLTSLGDTFQSSNLTSLRYLNLEGNRMRALSETSFKSLENLETLILTANQLEALESTTFQGLTHLKSLLLSRNKLLQLQKSWFQDLVNLETLDVHSNILIHVEDGAFQNQDRLARLDLSQNRLKTLEKLSMMGLENLQILDLSHNQLTAVPSSALLTFKYLKRLVLDGTLIRAVSDWDFQGLAIEEIHMNAMPRLTIIDSDAFLDLPKLAVLRMHDNPSLSYIDSGAFVDVPNLSALFLHNNSLRGLPVEIVTALPSLRVMSMYDNPIQCDCNVHWIKRILDQSKAINASLQPDEGSGNYSNVSALPPVTFQQPDKFVCHSPRLLRTTNLKDIPSGKIAELCPPTIIAYFNESCQRELGSSVTYECRAIGEPSPHIHWILSNGKVVNNTSNFSRIKLDRRGTLTVDHVKPMDAGTYTCVATNARDYDTTFTVLRVHSKDIRIIDKGAATNFITVTWNGTQSTIATSDYVILYRKQGSADEYGKIHLRPYMRTYTITNLQPQTDYDFCIAYQHDAKLVKLNCMDIKTKHQMFVMRGIRTVGNLTVLVALCLTCTFVILLCVLMVVVRRYRRRKSYHEPDGAAQAGPSGSGCEGGHHRGAARGGGRMSLAGVDSHSAASAAGSYKVDNMSHIPLDNLYNPPSTPLCTSQTSLISHSNA